MGRWQVATGTVNVKMVVDHLACHQGPVFVFCMTHPCRCVACSKGAPWPCWAPMCGISFAAPSNWARVTCGMLSTWQRCRGQQPAQKQSEEHCGVSWLPVLPSCHPEYSWSCMRVSSCLAGVSMAFHVLHCVSVAFHGLSWAFHGRFIALQWRFIAFHGRFIALQWRFIAFRLRCIGFYGRRIAFHALHSVSVAFHSVSVAFHSVSWAFQSLQRYPQGT